MIDLNTSLMAKIVLMPYTFTQIFVSGLKNFQLFAVGFRWENGGCNLPLSFLKDAILMSHHWNHRLWNTMRYVIAHCVCCL